MKTYKVTIITDCHAQHNMKFRNLLPIEARSIVKLARKSGCSLIVVREEKR